jgi:predicted phosphodiesterase
MAEVESINGNPIVAEVASESLTPVVDAWMTAHPDVTTTVQDGAVSTAKLSNGAVTDAKLAQTGGVLTTVQDMKVAGAKGFSALPYKFVNGGLNTSGAVIAQYHRIVTQDIIEADADVYLRIADGYRIWYAEYDEAGNTVVSTGWYASQFFIAEGKRFRLGIARNAADEVSGVVDIPLLSGKAVMLNSESYDAIGQLASFYSSSLDEYLRMRFTLGMYSGGKFIPQGYASVAKPFKFYKDITITNNEPTALQANVKMWTADEPIAANYIGTSGWVNSYTVPKDTWFTVEVAARSGSQPSPAQANAAVAFSFDDNIFDLDVDSINDLLTAEGATDTLAEKVKRQLSYNMEHRYFNGTAIVDAPNYYCMVSARTLPFDIKVDFSGKQFKLTLFNGDNEAQIGTFLTWATDPVWVPANTYFMLSAQDTTVHTLSEWYGYFNVSVSKDVDSKSDFVVPVKSYGSSYGVAERFQLLWFSDIHANGQNLTRIMQYADRHAADLNDVICTGDMVLDKFSDDYTFWHANGADKVLVVAGNHEGYKGNSGWATQQELYDKYFAPYIANWDVTYTAGYANWYKVYNSKVMLIGLTPYTTTTAEANELSVFLANALNIAKTNGYAVVVAHHYPADPAITTDVDTPFNTPNKVPRDMFIQGAVISAVESFVQSGGEFVCFITGHTHHDRTVRITSTGKLVLTIGTASTAPGMQDNSQFRSFTRTKYYDLFNILYVDTTAKVVSIKRIGSDRDMWFRKLDYLAVNYETGKIL